MNEIELLRNQLATERRRVREVASTCAAAHRAEPAMCDPEALASLRAACTAYLACVLDWFERRDERLRELSAPRPGGDPGPALEAALNLSGGRGAALARLAADGPARDRWQVLAGFIDGPWDTRRGAIEAALASNPRVADWRAFSGIDADSVWQERALYARFRAALPAGSRPGPA
jgi:hypothetical protein